MQIKLSTNAKINEDKVSTHLANAENIIKNYPDIEKCDEEIPEWHQKVIDERMKDLDNPDELISLEEFLEELNKEI